MGERAAMWTVPVSNEQLQRLIKYRMRWSDLFASSLFLYALFTVVMIFLAMLNENRVPHLLRPLCTPYWVIFVLWSLYMVVLKGYQFIAFSGHPHRRSIELALSGFMEAKRRFGLWEKTSKEKFLHQALEKLDRAKNCFGDTDSFKELHVAIREGLKQHGE